MAPETPSPETPQDKAAAEAARRRERLLDEALDETFPASDPIAPMDRSDEEA